jgi:hypothetical protein
LTAHHINAVSLVPYAYVNLEDASVNYNNERQWWGERTEGIIASNQMAHDHKMSCLNRTFGQIMDFIRVI